MKKRYTTSQGSSLPSNPGVGYEQIRYLPTAKYRVSTCTTTIYSAMAISSTYGDAAGYVLADNRMHTSVLYCHATAR